MFNIIMYMYYIFLSATQCVRNNYSSNLQLYIC